MELRKILYVARNDFKLFMILQFISSFAGTSRIVNWNTIKILEAVKLGIWRALIKLNNLPRYG